MSETASATAQKSQGSGIQSVPGTQGTRQAHTPGPWVVEVREAMETGSFHYNISNPTYDGPCPCGGKHPPGKLIAWLAGSLRGASDRDLPTESDARLISAAPDLLSALRGLGWAAQEPGAYGTLDCYDGCDRARLQRHSPSCEAARAAIAKATGR